MDPELKEILQNALPIAIGALLTVIGTTLQSFLQNRHALNVMRKQWDREDERAKKEAEEKRQIQIQETHQRERLRLTEAYGRAIRDLSLLGKMDEYPGDISMLREIMQEVDLYLVQILLYYPLKDDNYFASFRSVYVNFSELNEWGKLPETARSLRGTILLLAQQDPRLVP